MDTISFCYVVIQVSRFWVQGTCGIRVYTIVIQLLYIFLGHVKLTFWVVCLQSNCGNFWVGNLIIIAVYPQLVGVWKLNHQPNQPTQISSPGAAKAQDFEEKLRELMKPENEVPWEGLLKWIVFRFCNMFLLLWKMEMQACDLIRILGEFTFFFLPSCAPLALQQVGLKISQSAYLIVSGCRWLVFRLSHHLSGELASILDRPVFMADFLQIAIFFAGPIGREGEEGSGL